MWFWEPSSPSLVPGGSSGADAPQSLAMQRPGDGLSDPCIGQPGSGTCIRFPYWCMKKLQIWQLKATHIYYLTISVGQESGHSPARSPAQSLTAALQVSAGSHLRLRVF